MTKRAIAGLLWFVSVWALYEVLWSVASVPREAGPILGVVAAYLVVLDPLDWFWHAAIPHHTAASDRRLQT